MSRGRGMRRRRIEGISSQEYCSGLPFPSPGNLLNPETEPRSPALQTYSLPSLSYQGSPQIRVAMINNLTITKVAKKQKKKGGFHLFMEDGEGGKYSHILLIKSSLTSLD